MICTKWAKNYLLTKGCPFAEFLKMVKVASFFAMTFGAFLFWQTMDKVHVWIALHQDEKKERMEKEIEIRKMREELYKQQREKDSLA